MDLGLAGKAIVITGGAKGIGAAIVRSVAGEQAIPVIVDKDVTSGTRLCDEVRAAGTDCEFIAGDLSNPDTCATLVDQAFELAGQVHALVNNAGVNDGVGLETGSSAEFVASLQRNLLHYYAMTHHLLPQLKAAKGTIVNIGSKVAVTGQGGTSGYAAAKGAILALTREWAVDLLPYGIRVNAVLPAEVMTPLYREWLDTFPNPDEKLESIIRKIPLEQRMTKAEEIAAMVLFLLSRQAGHITGQHVIVDGGYVHLDRALT
jgi:L-fucose dehydrogenase